MRIGIHVRGFDAGKAVGVDRALERGAETFQIFASSPRQWRIPEIRPEADRDLVRKMKANDVRPLFIHAPYLVNLCSPTVATRRLALSRTQWTMERAFQLKARAVVVHAGSSVGTSGTVAVRRMARAISLVLGESTRGPRYLIELTAGGSGAVASTLEDAEQLIDACDGHSRLGICLDTCHLQAAGYEMATPQGVSEMLEEFRSRLGIKRLGLIHANDSRDPQDSRRDRHWHIGEGTIGRPGFRALVAHPMLANVPLICETPGKLEDDIRNVQELKLMRAGDA